MPKHNLVSRTDAEAELARYAREIRALSKQAIVEIGRRLIECERLCKAEGCWLQWLNIEFKWSRITADNFINVARAAARVKNFDTLNVPVSALYLLAAPSTPAEVIEAVAERGEQGERVSLAEVRTIIAEVKARAAPEIEDESSDGEEEAEEKPELRLVHLRHQVEITRESVCVPHYVSHEQPAPRTIEDFQRDRNRGRAEALARHLDGVERNLDERDTSATIKALTDEERDQARRVVDKLKAALDEDEMDVEVPDQLN
jgi:Protein of unknown function (DUF3102)